MRISIDKHWDSTPLAPEDRVSVEVSFGPTVTVRFDVKFQHPSIPDAPPGFFDGLWEYDVFELFAAATNGHYLEIEVGTGGHWLAYWFQSYRKRRTDEPPREGFKIESGGFSFPGSWLPAAPEECRWNFFVIRRTIAGDREYLAWQSDPTIPPDFHRVFAEHP